MIYSVANSQSEFNIFIWKASFYLVEFEFQKSNIGGKPIDVLIIK